MADTTGSEAWTVTGGTLRISRETARALRAAIAASPPCDLCGATPTACTVTNETTGATQRWCADCAQAYCRRHGCSYADLV